MLMRNPENVLDKKNWTRRIPFISCERNILKKNYFSSSFTGKTLIQEDYINFHLKKKEEINMI